MAHTSHHYDQSELRDVLYSTPDRLNQQIETHRKYSSFARPISGWLLDLIPLRGDEVAMDVGCGTGFFLTELAGRLPHGTCVGVDLAEGVLRGAQARLRLDQRQALLLTGDIQALPFVDGSFDFVMANYMLYHIPNLPKALCEVKRVLKPGGTFVALTHSEHNENEILAVFSRVVTRLGGELEATGVNVVSNFCAENGAAILGQVFPSVTTERLQHDLVFPTAETFMEYYRSLTLHRLFDHSPEEQQVVHDEVMGEISAEISRNGSFRVSASSAAFLVQV